MAANLNSDLNLNPLLDLVIASPYGSAICGFLFCLAIFTAIVFFIAKSGILSIIREHQEYKIRKIKDEINDQEELLKDDSLKKNKLQIQYHLNVSKLNKLLKYTHHDKDLLEYILSCKNKNLAIFYYESANVFLEKEGSGRKFKLKKYCKNWLVNVLNWIGVILYFVISLGSLYPTIYVFYLCIKAGESINKVPASFYISQIFLFFICLMLALILLSLFVKPWKAKQFLELEKI